MAASPSANLKSDWLGLAGADLFGYYGGEKPRMPIWGAFRRLEKRVEERMGRAGHLERAPKRDWPRNRSGIVFGRHVWP